MQSTGRLIMDSYISMHCPTVQWAGRLYMGVESRLSKCTMGWPVMYRGGVQAVWLYNRFVDSSQLYIGAAVRLCNGAG